MGIEHDINKLPIWARQRIGKLESDVHFWKDKVQALTSQTRTPIKCGFDTSTYYIDESRFEVTTSKGVFNIILRDDEGRDISSSRDCLMVIPKASNRIALRSVRR